MKYTLNVVTRLQDNGDGGWTMYAYNNEDELIAEHPKSSDYQEINGKYKAVKIELTPEEREKILNGYDDPYENGYIGKDTIEFEIDESGEPRLTKALHFHAGQ